jgi:hypothetical protein
MIHLEGTIHHFSKEIKLTIISFLVVLSIGFFGGLSFVNNTTSMSSSGVESHFLGNEEDENATQLKFKKSKREMLTLIHNHLLSLSVIFFLVALILNTTSLNKSWKLIFMIEPFLSLVITFGGLYFMWLGFTWVKYLVIISGILMTICFTGSLISIVYHLYFYKE